MDLIERKWKKRETLTGSGGGWAKLFVEGAMIVGADGMEYLLVSTKAPQLLSLDDPVVEANGWSTIERSNDRKESLTTYPRRSSSWAMCCLLMDGQIVGSHRISLDPIYSLEETTSLVRSNLHADEVLLAGVEIGASKTNIGGGWDELTDGTRLI